jgi:putative component of membrane protein insertase Oxa1/YidC/SpoIIIJ protein YidD
MRSFCFIFLLTITAPCFGQAVSDMKQIHTKMREVENTQVHSKKRVRFEKTYDPFKLILFSGLYVYQKVFSEQISAGCEFDISCSNFALQSIKKLGFFSGLMLAADRLTRCNGQAQLETEGYLIDHQTGKVIDEPEMYSRKKLKHSKP